jgi:hypothetical protein
LSDFFPTLTSSEPLQDAITSQYINQQLLKDNKLSYYMNTNADGPTGVTYDDYRTGLYNA